jgi:adenine-specific DNA-methyltransferase
MFMYAQREAARSTMSYANNVTSKPTFLSQDGSTISADEAAAVLQVTIGAFKRWQELAVADINGEEIAMPLPISQAPLERYAAADIAALRQTIALRARRNKSRQRAMGAYYTPSAASDFMTSWAIRSSSDVVIEPSVGDGQFALSAQQLARERGWSPLRIHACEIDEAAARRAVESGAIAPSLVHVGDFLALKDLPVADVVIGNPPFVRVRELSSQYQKNATDAMNEATGSDMDPSGSLWMPFVAKATRHLDTGGRLALVLPLDFTYVKYARSLWAFLARSFGNIHVLRFRQRVFGDISQNVLILLAEARGSSTQTVNMVASESLADFLPEDLDRGARIPLTEILSGERSFQKALLPQDTIQALAQLVPHSVRARDLVKFNIGYVSGNREYFHPAPETISKYRLPETSLIPSIMTSRQLNGMGVNTSSHNANAHLWVPRGQLTRGEQDYVHAGEMQGVDMGYKCRIRQPWYQVPGIRVPDIILTTFSDRPRLHVNDAGWVASNSILCGYANSAVDPSAFVRSWYSPLTALSTELEIHSLGGGVLVAVPREADAVRLLKLDASTRTSSRTIDAALRSDSPAEAYSAGAENIKALIGTSGLRAIEEGTNVLTRWRKAKG